MGHANEPVMSIGPINNLNNTYLQSIFSSTLQQDGLSTGGTNRPCSVLSVPQPDIRQLSPMAQMISRLQQLQQTDPSKYQQLTAQIAKNLQSAASTASVAGNTAAASQLNQLANDFKQASQTGQLPNFQGLAQAAGHHHQGHHHVQETDAPLAAFQTGSAPTDSPNPTAIIMNALNQAGISTANG